MESSTLEAIHGRLESGCLSVLIREASTLGLIGTRGWWLQIYHCIGRSYRLSDNVLKPAGEGKERVSLGTYGGISSLPDSSIEFIYYLQRHTYNLSLRSL